jgi:hypothetical protein
VQPEQIVRTLPFALALAKDATIPVQTLEIEQTLAHMTLTALMHPHHTVDAFYRTPGPNRVSQEFIHTPIGTLPLRTQALTQHLLDHDQLTETNTGVTLRLLHLVVDVPQAR